MERSLLPKTAGNENTGLLKLLALLFMVVDHVGAALLPGYLDLRLIGRIALPLYGWCLVVGISYTHDWRKYALRMLAAGLLSQPCYVFAMNHAWAELNIFATLLLGLLGIAGIREKKAGSQYWAPALALLIPLAVKMDYGWKGVAFILLLYAARESRGGLVAMMIGFCLFWAQDTLTLPAIFGVPVISYIPALPEARSLLNVLCRVQFYAVLALPLMLWRSQARLRLPKWFAYLAYPGHLLLIGLIRHYLM